MKQIRAEISIHKKSWTASVWLEAWALYPEHAPKAPTGTPGAPNTAGMKWIKTLNSSDFEIMREITDAFLRKYFILRLNDKILQPNIDFPEISHLRPQLKENADGNALVKVNLSGKLPASPTGVFTINWEDPEKEPLLLTLKQPETKLFRLSASPKPVEILHFQSHGKISASNNTSLWTWIKVGFEHILPLGTDHICFILGLFFLQPKWKPLLLQTSAFTLAHSITLAMVVLGVFTAPASVVEPMIALSIAYVGFENLWVRELKPWRIGLVFGLGLLHGMGFASVMKELNLPQDQVIQPLIGFNLGVELGQVTVLLLAFLATGFFLKKASFSLFRKIISALIGVIGVYWTFQRLLE